ncbi:MAG: histone H1 [Proteobacteria bacterium]|nr:histone H1 [Pseudomonadota bacterium]
MAKNPKRPRDPNQLAKSIVGIAVGDEENVKPTPSNADRRKGGLKGGKARAKALTAKQRKEIAEKAAKSRWNKH